MGRGRDDLSVNEERKSGIGKWLMLGALLLVLAAVFRSRDRGVEFRQAVFQGEIDTVEQLLAVQPALVNMTNSLPPVMPTHGQRQPMSWMEKMIVAAWESMTGMEARREDIFSQLEAAQLPPLQIAVIKGDGAMVELLLKHSADVTAQSSGGMTALHYAASRETRLVRLLLAHKAPINTPNSYRLTPLLLSVHQSNGENLRLLLESGANPNVSLANGLTPLHAAVNTRTTNALALLLKHGARLDNSNNQGRTALDLAKEQKLTNAIELLTTPLP
jgi:hypothetical protein